MNTHTNADELATTLGAPTELNLSASLLLTCILALKGRKTIRHGQGSDSHNIKWEPRIVYGKELELDISVYRDGFNSPTTEISALPLPVLLAYTKILENFEAWKTGKVDWPKLVD